MVFDVIQRWRDVQAYRKLCKYLVRKFGSPEWYSVGQVKKAIEETRSGRLTPYALHTLTNETKDGRDGEREEFSSQFLDGQRRFTAKHVIKNFVTPSYISAGDFQNGPSDVGAEYAAGDIGGGD